jgi:hypothetical protein
MKGSLLRASRPALLAAAIASVTALPCAAARAEEARYIFGVARADITPTYPVRLSGYGSRREEATKTADRLWAKALALSEEGGAPLLLLTVDNTGVPRRLTEELARRLESKAGLERARFALASSHSHTAPCLEGALETLFGVPVSPEHQAGIARYTRELLEQLEKVSLEALRALAEKRRGTFAWAQGKVGFAANRRTPGGPVDHDLPLLAVRDAEGTLRAAVTGYACHCTTLGGDFNEVSGDWAGYAQAMIEADHEGAVALVTIGCGADSNPSPRTGLEHARAHGRALADEARRLLAGKMEALGGPLGAKWKELELPFDKLPERAEWEKRALREDAVGHQARVVLERLKSGVEPPSAIPYPVQVWTVGGDLAMVFLPGEVVVDYSLRLKRELGRKRLWVSAYSNDVPCYIPSRRILAEGGYEAEGAMVYYNLPGRLRPEVEEMIIAAVRELVPPAFRAEVEREETKETKER